jgi:hypothetical protein
MIVSHEQVWRTFNDFCALRLDSGDAIRKTAEMLFMLPEDVDAICQTFAYYGYA